MSASRLIAFALLIALGIGGFYLLVVGINNWAADVREQQCNRLAGTMHRIESAETSEAKPEGQAIEQCRIHELEPGAVEGGRA